MNKKILPCVVGLGYVGLPVFLRLQNHYKTIGYDISDKRIAELSHGFDCNIEYSKNQLKLKKKSYFSSDLKYIKNSNFFIICVPTPIFSSKIPNLNFIYAAINVLSKVLKRGDIIFLESTVYPGLTSEIIKVLEKKTNLRENLDFFVGYSPERINPGDKKNKIQNIDKIVAFRNIDKNNISKVKKVYEHLAKKIIFTKKIEESETAKVIENIQRDINIAFMNEVLVFSKKLNLNFSEIIRLASTKWNFLKFQPGLVGGHCLPVDPYYLYHAGKKKGISLKTILAGRKVNDNMVKFVINQIKKNTLLKKNKTKILIMGLSYKPNVADFRNSLSLTIFKKIYNKYKHTLAYDPYMKELKNPKIKKINKIIHKKFDLVVVLTNHKIFKKDLYKFKKFKISILRPFL